MAKRRPAAPRITVGWNELVALPDWGVHLLPAKIDTGARSCSLHVIDTVLDGDHVAFTVPHADDDEVRVHTAVARIARVTSSNGRAQRRIFITTRLHLGPVIKTVECNLVDRGDMRFPMLIGRTALHRHFLVNPGKRRLVSPPTDPGKS